MITFHWRSALTTLLLALLLVGSTPLLAQSPNGITSPTPGAVVTGAVTMTGSANDPDFLRYEVAFLSEANAAAGWILFAESTQPVTDGVLAVWDTTIGRAVGAPVFPDGSYQLRLRIVRNDFNYTEYFITNIRVANDSPPPAAQPPTPVPTFAPTATPAFAPTVTPQEAAPAQTGPTATPTITPTPTPLPTTDSLVAPTLPPPATATPLAPLPGGAAPTLTPFPVPTLAVDLDDSIFSDADNAGADDSAESESGVFARIRNIEVGRYSDAFQRGFTLTFYLFALLGVYLLVRAAARWVWQFARRNW